MNREAPTVSVIIPAYNHAQYILETLESVFAQTFSEAVEIIVVNDGSPDNTAQILDPFFRDGRIQFIEQANAGQAAARNRGIAMAKGEFIALLDDDDLIPTDKLMWQVAALRANPDVAVVVGQLERIQTGCISAPLPTGSTTAAPFVAISCGDALYAAFLEHNRIVSPGQCLIRRSVLSELGEPPFDPAIWGSDDWDLWLRLAQRHNFLFEDRLALYYRLHDTNASRNQVRMFRGGFHLLKKHELRSRRNPCRVALIRAARARFRVNVWNSFRGVIAERRTAGDTKGALRQTLLLALHFPDLYLRQIFSRLRGVFQRGIGERIG